MFPAVAHRTRPLWPAGSPHGVPASLIAVLHAPSRQDAAVTPGLPLARPSWIRLVDTAFLRGGTGRSDEQGESVVNFASYLAAIPLKQLAVPEDIVGPIRFLLGPDSGYMTGQVLWINGGAYMP